MSRLKKLQGRFRLRWGLCPECNSDAPEVYDCRICEGYQSIHHFEDGEFPVTKERKAEWWDAFTQAKCTHGVPMGRRCNECDEWRHNHLGRSPGNPRR